MAHLEGDRGTGREGVASVSVRCRVRASWRCVDLSGGHKP